MNIKPWTGKCRRRIVEWIQKKRCIALNGISFHEGGNHIQYQYAVNFSPFRVGRKEDLGRFSIDFCACCAEIARSLRLDFTPPFFFLLLLFCSLFFLSSTSLWYLPYSTRQDLHHSYTGTFLDALHLPWASVGVHPWYDMAYDNLLLLCQPIMQILLGLGRIVFQVFYLLVSVMLLDSFVGWVGLALVLTP